MTLSGNQLTQIGHVLRDTIPDEDVRAEVAEKLGDKLRWTNKWWNWAAWFESAGVNSFRHRVDALVGRVVTIEHRENSGTRIADRVTGQLKRGFDGWYTVEHRLLGDNSYFVKFHATHVSVVDEAASRINIKVKYWSFHL